MRLYHRIARKVVDRLPSSFVSNLVSNYDPNDPTREMNAGATVSFDAFDTLITRPLARPSDLFLVVGHRLSRSGLIEVGAEQWRSLRCAAEDEARRRNGDREVTLGQIYSLLLIALPNLDAAQAQAIEISVEKALIRPIAANVDALRRAAERGPTYVLSDTYLDVEDLTKMCIACGVDPSKTKILASSETGDTKNSGRLFAHIKRTVSDRRIHIGDNFFADVWRARHTDCAPFLYTDSHLARLERLLETTRIEPAILRSALAGSARSARLHSSARDRSKKAVAAVSAGFSGPMLLAFVVWILVRAKSRGIKKLYFLARDGEILIKIAQAIVAKLGLDIELRYLFVSRKALHLPALVSLDGEAFTQFSFFAGQTLSEMLAKFGLADSKEAIERSQALLGPQQALNDPLSKDAIEQIKTFIRNDPEMRALVEARAAEQRELLLDYLRQEEMLTPDRIAVVDIGWRGTLQRSLCKVLETVEPHAASRVSGFYYGLYNRPTGAGHLEAFIDRPEAAGLRPFVRGSMFEAVCAARHGTTVRYARDDVGTVRPVFASSDNPEAEQWGLTIQQEAIGAFVDNVLAVLDASGHDVLDHSEALTKASLVVTEAFVGLPIRQEAETLGSFPHAVDQAHKDFQELAAPLPLSPNIWKQRYTERAFAPMISYWPEASIVRSVPTPIAHALLKALEYLRAYRDRRRCDESAASMLTTRPAD